MSTIPHQFHCQEELWARVEMLAKRRGMSTDDVIQAALFQLFKAKKKAPSAATVVHPSPSPTPTGPTIMFQEGRGGDRTVIQEGSQSRTLAFGDEKKISSEEEKPVDSAIAADGTIKPVYLFYENQCIAIDTEEFVIGRSIKHADLAIKDANISRRHCAIVRQGHEYFIKDLDSTNGIEFSGKRVESQKIEEGQVYLLCDHQLRFSFHMPASP